MVKSIVFDSVDTSGIDRMKISGFFSLKKKKNKREEKTKMERANLDKICPNCLAKVCGGASKCPNCDHPMDD